MLYTKLIQLASERWEKIADRVVRQMQRDADTYDLGRLPAADLRERARQIITQLPEWLTSADPEIGRVFEQLGQRRFEEGIPLYEMVRALQLIRESTIRYVRDQGLAQTALDLHAERMFQTALARIFDRMIFYVVRGYERSMRGRTRGAA